MPFHLKSRMSHALWSPISFIFTHIVPFPLKRKNPKFEICILNSFWDTAILILGFWDQINSKMVAVKFNIVFKLKYLKKKSTQKPEFFYTVTLVGRDHKYSKITIFTSNNLIFTEAFEVWKKFDPAPQYRHIRESQNSI